MEIKDGIIIINKPKNCTSHDIVKKIKNITQKKVGHTGTLDPLAQGVLPILIGKATLCSKYLINHDKTYEVTLKLGETTKTLDEEGPITKTQQIPSNILTEQNIKTKLKQFEGKQKQTPPIYSAIKVKGKKLYEYARKNEEVEIKPREIEIYKIELEEINKQQKTIKFTTKCSKGTYIRTLCADIAKSLGTIGYMKELKRLQVGEFKIQNSITIQEDPKINEKQIAQNIITIEKIFEKNPKIEIKNNQITHFLNGVKITIEKPDGIYKIYNQNKFIGTGILQKKLLKRDIII